MPSPLTSIWKYKLLTNGVGEKLIYATKIHEMCGLLFSFSFTRYHENKTSKLRTIFSPWTEEVIESKIRRKK